MSPASLTRWFIDNPVAANLLMVFILVAGFLSLSTLRVESFPQVPPSRIIVSVVYPGGTAKQVDEGITQRIEDAVSGIAGIKSITSESQPGFAQVVIKKNTGVDLTKLMDNVRNQVDGIVGFPTQAERPTIVRDEFGNLALFVMIFGSQSDATLQQIATQVENRLKRDPAISQVTNLGKRRKQLQIEPDLQALKRYGLDVDTLSERIHRWSLEYRSGELRTARGRITLRGDEYADNLLKLKQLPIITSDDAVVRLGDIAHVSRAYEDTESIVRFQGQSAIALMVSTSQKDNLFRVSEATRHVLSTLEPTLPDNTRLEVMADMSPYIQEQLDLLGTNAWQGLAIVIILLGLFLEVRLALWVALGIPISIAGAVFLMGVPSLDYSINDITLFGMILVLGILVDDAVVVGESIHEARQRIKDPQEAARQGVESVAVATIFGVLTTIAAFSPMLWIENELAQVLAGFSAVVIFALIFSLIESKFILPTHLCLPPTRVSKTPSWRNTLNTQLAALRQRCTDGLTWFSENVYMPTLDAALAQRKLALSVFVIFMLGAYIAMTKGQIKSAFFPEIPGRYATLKIEMDQDAALALTQQHVKHLQNAATQTNRQLQQTYVLDAPPIEKTLIWMDAADSIEVTLALSREALTEIPSQQFLDAWRLQTGPLEGAYSTKFTFSEDAAGGTAISISAQNMDVARQVAKQLKAALRLQPGVNDVFDDSQVGSRQLQITLNERGRALGIDQRRLATLVGGAFGQMDIHRLLDAGEETRVVLNLPQQSRKTLAQLRETPVNLGDGKYVALGEISEFTFSRQADVIYRRNRDQVVSVYWLQDRKQQAPEATLANLMQSTIPTLSAQYPNVIIKPVGEFDEILDVQTGFKKAMLLTILLIYVLLAIPLKSYFQPLIIMSVIPFGFAGAIYGHGMMDLPVSILSLFGMMAMTGVVINDSLVLMTRFNQLYASGMALKSALITAGRSRLRAIFLTTVTTVCGLLPLLSETSEQAQYLKPAAVSLVFGELFATPITLILIPLLLSFKGEKAQAVTLEANGNVTS